MIILIIHRFFMWKWIPCQAVTSVLCLLFRPKTVHCSTKNAYTSEITFLALVPCFIKSLLFKLIKPHSPIIGWNMTFPISTIFMSIQFFYNFSKILWTGSRKIMQTWSRLGWLGGHTFVVRHVLTSKICTYAKIRIYLAIKSF